MRNRGTEIIVGAVTLLALAILIGVTVNLKSSTIFSRKYPVIGLFKDVKRLEEGAAVYIHGVVRGDVREIRPTGRADYPVRVVMMLAEGAVLHEGAKPRLITAGLIGETEINIEDPKPTAPVLKANTELLGQAMTDLSDLLEQSPEIIQDLQVTMESISGFLSDKKNQNAVANILNSMSSFTLTVNQTFGASSSDIRMAAQNVRIATEQLNRLMLRADSTLTTVGGSLASAGNRINASIDELRTSAARVLARLDAVGSQIDTAAARANRLLDTADQILTENRVEARQAVEGLSSATVHLSRILGRIDQGQGTLGEVLIGPDAYKELSTSIEGLSKSVEVVQRLVEGLDRWLTGVGRREATIDIPYEVPPPAKPGRRK
jgi:ABC-type transporter Mla subunit MlaD